MKKLYVIASTWRDVELTIDHFYTPEKAVRKISDLVSDEFGRKANPTDSPLEYLQDYWEWVREENDNMCEVVVELKVIDLN